MIQCLTAVPVLIALLGGQLRVQPITLLLTRAVQRTLPPHLALTGGTRRYLPLLPLLSSTAASTTSRALRKRETRNDKKQQTERN